MSQLFNKLTKNIIVIYTTEMSALIIFILLVILTAVAYLVYKKLYKKPSTPGATPTPTSSLGGFYGSYSRGVMGPTR